MDSYQTRKRVIQGSIILVAFIYLVRLFYLQVFDDTYKKLADTNVIRKITVYPARGQIYDRNGELIVYNEAIYDIMAVPSKVEAFDSAAFCQLLDVSPEHFHKNFKKAADYSVYKSSPIVKQVPMDIYARFQEHLYQFNGFYRQVRTVRKYPYTSAAHVLGYIGEIDQDQLETYKAYYRLGDYIGISGIEKAYEQNLRGKRGIKHVLVDVHNREQGPFLNKAFDTLAVAGKNLRLTLDVHLQQYGEELMQGKRGSIVAIEPTTGEVLVMVSSPTYDPNILSGRKRGESIKRLNRDTLKPLFNRAIMAEQYPPGSTFKPIMALIGLQEGVITPETVFHCNGGYHMRGLTVGCLSPGSFQLQKAIQRSCNTYFCNVYRRIIDQDKFKNAQEGFEHWRNHLLSFGLGGELGIDIPNEGKGLLPSVDLYNKMYGKGRWRSSTTISLAIGQGELGVTPLQLTNYMAAIANRGYYYTPHLVKEVSGDTTVLDRFRARHYSTIDTAYFPIVIDGMEDVVLAGSGRIAQIPGISVCGKTGTAENPHGEDHSFFASFAPKNDPRIAIMVIVENSGFGSTFAAPIASLMIEKYLTDSIADSRKWLEKRMLEANLIDPS